MERGSVTPLAGKLLAALEKSGISSGAELRSSLGPSGPPAQELVRSFEEALSKGPETISTDVSGTDTSREMSGFQRLDPTPALDGAVNPDPTIQEIPAPEAAGMDNPSGWKPEYIEARGVEQTLHPQASADVQDVRPTGSDPLRELENIANRMEAGQMTAEDLFRMQYLIGMLKVQTESGMQASRKTAQGFDSLLKQQG